MSKMGRIQAYSRQRLAMPTERAYLAGFFDGDGCVDTVHSDGAYSLRIRFGQTRRQALQLIRCIYGVEITPSPPSKENGQIVYTVEFAQRLAVFAFLEDIYPFVREKRQQVKLALGVLRTDRRVTKVCADIVRALKYRTESRPFIPAAVALGRFYGTWKRPTSPSQTALAYIAGFFDAEGCLRPKVIRGRYWSIDIRFGQVLMDGPLLLAKTYGGSIKKSKPRGTRQSLFTYDLTIWDGVRCFLDDVWPFVLEKQEQVAIAKSLLVVQWRKLPLHRVLKRLQRIHALNPKSQSKAILGTKKRRPPEGSRRK